MRANRTKPESRPDMIYKMPGSFKNCVFGAPFRHCQGKTHPYLILFQGKGWVYRCALLLIALSVLPSCIYGNDIDANAILEKVKSNIVSNTDIAVSLRIDGNVNGDPQGAGSAFYFRSARSNSFLLIYTRDAERGVSYLCKGRDVVGFAPHVNLFFTADRQEQLSSPALACMNVIYDVIGGDYETLGIEDTMLANFPCYKIELKANDMMLQLPRLTLWIKKDILVPVKAQFGDKDVVASRTLYFYRWGRYGSVYFPESVLFVSEIEKKTSYKLTFDSTTLTTLPDFIFTRAFCEYMGN
jgi:hypothetical protein